MGCLIQNVLIADEAGYHVTDIAITDTCISEIAPQLPSTSTCIDGQDKLLLPGFVNGHTHSSQIWQRGLVPQLPLELWLANVFDATESSSMDDFYLGAMSTAVDTLLSGGTCLMDHAYVVAGREVETVAAIVRAYKEVGIRAFIAPLIFDQPMLAGIPTGVNHTPDSVTTGTAETLALMEEIVRQFHEPDAGIQIAVGPTGFHRCSDELLMGCIALSERYNLCRHTHLLETRAQKLLAQERYGGSAVAHLKQLGFLDHRTSLAHSVWLDDSDIAILATTGATVVHNPVSNLRLGSGIAPILKYLRAGVNVGFGCDGSASNDAQNLFEALKLGTILHTVTDIDYQHWLTPARAVQMAALGGAKGVNLATETGSLTVGKKADLVLYDLTHPSLQPLTDPLQLLVLGRPTQVVDSVWINGKQVVAAGKVTTVDAEQLCQTLRDRHRSRSQPQFQTLPQLEPRYRRLLNQLDAI